MTLSKRAIDFAVACRDGDIIDGKPVQLESLARNIQVLIDEYEGRITELTAELDYLKWFHVNADFGPADTDVVMAMQAEYAKLKPVPPNWLYE